MVIYGITNTINGFVYVGCTGDERKRMREHRSLLRRGIHACSRLQEEWLRDGEKAFSLTVFETFPDDASVVTKRARELYWMQVHESKLYNTWQISFSPVPHAAVLGRAKLATMVRPRHTTEWKAANSLRHRGIPKNHGAKISATKQRRKLELMI